MRLFKRRARKAEPREGIGDMFIFSSIHKNLPYSWNFTAQLEFKQSAQFATVKRKISKTYCQ
jgi:hypothetical protein